MTPVAAIRLHRQTTMQEENRLRLRRSRALAILSQCYLSKRNLLLFLFTGLLAISSPELFLTALRAVQNFYQVNARRWFFQFWLWSPSRGDTHRSWSGRTPIGENPRHRGARCPRC